MNIIIGKPQMVQHNDNFRLVSTIVTPDREKYDLYYEVSKEYKDYLVTELSDAFLVCMLIYAMDYGYDIVCKGDISYSLYYQLVDTLIPTISSNIKDYKAIKITCNLSNLKFGGTSVGTGLSCGADSFYTILKTLQYDERSGMKPTHLCCFNAGAVDSNETIGKARNVWQERVNKFKDVAAQLGCNFLTVDTNMKGFLNQPHQGTHTFRTLSVVLALQKLFSRYYFSSTYKYEAFEFMKLDCSITDLMNLPCLSNQNITFFSYGGEASRMQKLEYISNYPIVHKNLHVCIGGATNCNKCRKCIGTMYSLYCLNQLDNYKSVFDTETFYKNKDKYLIFLIIDNHYEGLDDIVDFLIKRKDIKPQYIKKIRRNFKIRLFISKIKNRLLKPFNH